MALTSNSHVRSRPARANVYIARAATLITLALLAAAPMLAFGAAAERPSAAAAAPSGSALEPGAPGGKDAAPAADVGPELKHSDAGKRREAAGKLLYGKGRAQESDILVALRAEPKPDIRAELLRAAASAPEVSTATLAALAEALGKDESPLVRSVAASQLGRLRGGKAGREALTNCLEKDPDLDVRRACAYFLGSYPDAESLKALKKAAKDSNPRLRLSAAGGLDRQADVRENEVLRKDAETALKGLEKDADAEVRAKARAGGERRKKEIGQRKK